MQTCSHGHDEIVYDGRNCPLCAALEDIEDLQQALRTITKDADSLLEKRDEYRDLLEQHNPELLI